jgi:hypothetical protein
VYVDDDNPEGTWPGRFAHRPRNAARKQCWVRWGWGRGMK